MQQRPEEVQRAEALLESMLKMPQSPRATMRELIKHKGVNPRAAREAFSDMLSMKKIQYLGPDKVVFTGNELGKRGGVF